MKYYPFYPRHESAIIQMDDPVAVEWSDLNELRQKASRYDLIKELED